MAVPFKDADFIGLFNFECRDQNKVGNITIFVLLEYREKLYCLCQESRLFQKIPLTHLKTRAHSKHEMVNLILIVDLILMHFSAVDASSLIHSNFENKA